MLKPKKSDQIFFELFSDVIDETCAASAVLEGLFKNYENADEQIATLEEYEHKCDRTVHDLINYLNHSFITPFDREDIFLIAKVIDNIMDNIESTAFSLKLLNIQTIRPESFEMAELIVKCAKELKEVVDELDRMKVSKTIQAKIIEVNRIENQGDEAYRRIMRGLFSAEKDTLEIIKWKEIYEYMEKTRDACEDVANIIEGIVSKNA